MLGLRSMMIPAIVAYPRLVKSLVRTWDHMRSLEDDFPVILVVSESTFGFPKWDDDPEQIC